jgi:hypothetical protein
LIEELFARELLDACIRLWRPAASAASRPGGRE